MNQKLDSDGIGNQNRMNIFMKPKHTLLALLISLSAQAQVETHFAIPASVLDKGSTGIFRSFCVETRLFVAFNGKSGFSSVTNVKNGNNTPVYCEHTEFVVLSEEQVPALPLDKKSSGIGRILTLGDNKFMLYTSRSGASDLSQFF